MAAVDCYSNIMFKYLSNLISAKLQSFSNLLLLFQNHQKENMFILLFFLFAFTLSFSVSLFFLLKTFYKPSKKQNDPSRINRSLTQILDPGHQTRKNDPTHLTRSLLLDILPSNSPEWAALIGPGDPDQTGSGSEGAGPGGDLQRVVKNKKKKKKRAKKKRLDSNCEENGGEDRVLEVEREGFSGSGLDLGLGRFKPELVCLYPFTSTSSATQRKIKQQYDQLVKCNESKGLTLAQVGEFANCLIEARNELQHKSEVIKRRFTITKALLFKADRSSVDRLRQQIYKLELEQKRLEEDAFVYNWLQQQLKLSPAYKKMLEINACMELKAKSGELLDSNDTEFADISFEELLAQEKKDAFWQKNGKLRPCSS